MASLIKSGELSEIKEAMDKNLAPGTQQTFEQSLSKLYIAGKIPLDKALKNSDSPTNLSWLINTAGSKEELAKQGLSDVEQQAVTDNDFASFNLER